MKFVFEPYQTGDGGQWSAACQDPDCLWTYESIWEPYGDGAELAALAMAAAVHERDPAADYDRAFA